MGFSGTYAGSACYNGQTILIKTIMPEDEGRSPLKPLTGLLGVMMVLSFCGLVAITFNTMPEFFNEDLTYIDDLISNEDEFTPEPEKQVLSMKVTSYPNILEHTCKNFQANLRLTNDGTETIYYEDVYDPSNNYNLFFTINRDKVARYSYGLNEYDIDTGQKVGLEDFGSLEPGESKDVIFHGGGMVMETLSYSGQPTGVVVHESIFIPGEVGYGGQVGANELQLLWGSNYDEQGIFTIDKRSIAKSEVMNVQLLSDQCDRTDIQRTEDQ